MRTAMKVNQTMQLDQEFMSLKYTRSAADLFMLMYLTSIDPAKKNDTPERHVSNRLRELL